MSVDLERASRAIAEFLSALGHDPSREPELEGTPERVARAFAEELLAGAAVDLGALVRESLSAALTISVRQPVVVKGLRVVTVCPHHLMPALGEASVAYLPGEHLIGIGAVARVVRAAAARLTLQEQIGPEVLGALVEHAQVELAACRITLRHSCLSARGAREHAAEVETWCVRGGRSMPRASIGSDDRAVQALLQTLR
ncbi:MAG: GTP cyclohydrolase I [Polyangiaceae bacterium]|nr:GTP cyclohydrolase I [Polyangiaceae bacterium]MCW5790200.1 GTP cyclohydrolase I [Polyangiaceae bacterium]